MIGHRRHLLVSAVLVILFVALPAVALASGGAFIQRFRMIRTVASTIPGNGDVNPYGVALVPTTVGRLRQGNVLVSNFNNSGNLQGTGTTIVQIAPNGKVSQFAQIDPTALGNQCPGGVGLTDALAVLRRGWVIVGSLPTSDGMSATMKAGCLIVLNSAGQVVETFAGSPINGPWGATVDDGGDQATLFVTNVLNGTVAANGAVVNGGTILRIDLDVPEAGYGMPRRESTTIIGSGFAERTDPAALVVGPLGLGIEGDTLYVADSVNNRIARIPNATERRTSAGTGGDVATGGFLNDPLGLTIAPNGDILSTNGNDGFLVETTPRGTQVARTLIDNTGTPPGSGCLFGLVVAPGGSGVYYADDCSNTLNLLR